MATPSPSIRSVLIVDDDDNLRTTIRQYAESLGIDVWEAPNGIQALWIIEQQRPSLILLDLKMPRLDGFETLRHIRDLDPDVRVVLVTGDPSDETRQRLARLNLETLMKPLAIEDLDRVFAGG